MARAAKQVFQLAAWRLLAACLPYPGSSARQSVAGYFCWSITQLVASPDQLVAIKRGHEGPALIICWPCAGARDQAPPTVGQGPSTATAAAAAAASAAAAAAAAGSAWEAQVEAAEAAIQAHLYPVHDPVHGWRAHGEAPPSAEVRNPEHTLQLTALCFTFASHVPAAATAAATVCVPLPNFVFASPPSSWHHTQQAGATVLLCWPLHHPLCLAYCACWLTALHSLAHCANWLSHYALFLACCTMSLVGFICLLAHCASFPCSLRQLDPSLCLVPLACCTIPLAWLTVPAELLLDTARAMRMMIADRSDRYCYGVSLRLRPPATLPWAPLTLLHSILRGTPVIIEFFHYLPNVAKLRKEARKLRSKVSGELGS
eukprot:1158048-Pelagomonas_calceolata.AAC.8